MRKDQSSLTAMGIAVVRAVESARPEGERICYDPYARRFVSEVRFHLVRFFDKLGYGEWRGPGVNHYRKVAYGYAIVSAIIKPKAAP